MISNHAKKKALLGNMAIFFDFDEVLHSIDESEKKSASVANSADLNLLQKIIHLSIKHNYPLFIITARADNEENRDFITRFVASIKGFHEGVGGFHLNDIHFLGVEAHQKKHKKAQLIGIRQQKVKSIQEIHGQKLSVLSNKQIWFIDDEEKHIAPVEKAGYSVIRATSGNNKHLEEMLEIMQKNIEETYSYYTPQFYKKNNQSKEQEPKEIKKHPSILLKSKISKFSS